MKITINNTDYRLWFRYIRPKAKVVLVTPKKGPNKGIPEIQTIKQAPTGVQAYFVRFDAPVWKDECKIGVSHAHPADVAEKGFDREKGRRVALVHALKDFTRDARKQVWAQYDSQRGRAL
jgi:hypothetical protein